MATTFAENRLILETGSGWHELLASRSLGIKLPPPHPHLQRCVVVPVRNEEAALPALFASLEAQCDALGEPIDPGTWEVILLLNNCIDASAAVARRLASTSVLRWQIAEVMLAPDEANVGRARQQLFDLAWTRFDSLHRPTGLILTTDADTRPASNWLASTCEEIAHGVDAVGGRVFLDPREVAALPAGVRRLFLLDIGYRRLLEEMRALLAPEAHDPFPRHHQHFGGSLAITAEAYRRAGGMPAVPTSEDVALYRALRAVGGKLRHSSRVRVVTSARIVGRAHGGMADALGWWKEQATEDATIWVESAAHAEQRLTLLGRWMSAYPSGAPPWALLATPEPPPAGHSSELRSTIGELRQRVAALRALPLEERLAEKRSNTVARQARRDSVRP